MNALKCDDCNYCHSELSNYDKYQKYAVVPPARL